MKYLLTSVAVVMTLTGCGNGPVPTSDDYFDSITPQSEAGRRSEERLRAAEGRSRETPRLRISDEVPENRGTPVPVAATPDPIDAAPQPPAETELDLSAQTEALADLESAAPDASDGTADAPAPVTETAAVPIAERDTSRVSDSDDFEAVQQVETVRSEAERVAELGKTYRTFDPEALPQRDGSVDLDDFAKDNQTRVVGKKRYRRDGDRYTNDFCKNYLDVALAQVSFLAQGGPRKDPLLLDRDGDGFACSWTPRGHLRNGG